MHIPRHSDSDNESSDGDYIPGEDDEEDEDMISEYDIMDFDMEAGEMDDADPEFLRRVAAAIEAMADDHYDADDDDMVEDNLGLSDGSSLSEGDSSRSVSQDGWSTDDEAPEPAVFSGEDEATHEDLQSNADTEASKETDDIS